MLHIWTIWTIEFTYLDDLWLASAQESYVSLELVGYLIYRNGILSHAIAFNDVCRGRSCIERAA